MRRLLSSLVGLILALQTFTLSAETKGDWQDFDGKAQGTTYRIRYFGPSEKLIAPDIEKRLQEIDRVFSNYRKDSAIELFNAKRSKDWQTVPSELARLVIKAKEFSELTSGAFDITIGQLLKVWGFGPYKSHSKKKTIPTDAAIAEALARSGYRKLEAKLDPPSLKKLNPDILVDLSGIAQGYTVDQLGELLEQKTIRSYLVEVGGELRGRGTNKEGKAWQVAVENPEVDSGLGNILSLSAASLSTSGNYRDYVEIHGIRYSHIFDPRVGRPIPSEFVSASVMTADCTTADALAKAFLILSEPEQKALATKLQLAVLLQKRVGKDFTSSRLGNFP
ncbi:MAG: FAD:protein FMN transferase [Proteobacteria bacterium]|nr:MAG: FAD:protein FMN transferase [Pseudomonadota bacterium]